jgi:hypothetical protein
VAVKTTIRSEGRECISSGVYLAELGKVVSLRLEDDTDQIDVNIQISHKDNQQPTAAFRPIGPSAALILVEGATAPFGFHFGPISIGVFKGRKLSLSFRPNAVGDSVEVIYSFWLGDA